MGIEIRRVPGNWQHPKDNDGNFIPLFDGGKYTNKLIEWLEGGILWERGMVRMYGGKPGDLISRNENIKAQYYEDWAGPRPDQDDYMPDWPEKDKTHIMMYENSSGGTPISPACKTAEQLALWMANNEALGYTYEQWLSMCKLVGHE